MGHEYSAFHACHGENVSTNRLQGAANTGDQLPTWTEPCLCVHLARCLPQKSESHCEDKIMVTSLEIIYF